MSRAKILKNIKKNTIKKVKRENFEYPKITFEDKKEAFLNSLKKAGGDEVQSVEGFDVVLEADFGVCENGACFISSVRDKKEISFYESIVIKLSSNSLLDNMHEALKKVKLDEFGIFLSGPSKTADIEQSLVIGAHGAKKVCVFFGDN